MENEADPPDFTDRFPAGGRYGIVDIPCGVQSWKEFFARDRPDHSASRS